MSFLIANGGKKYYHFDKLRHYYFWSKLTNKTFYKVCNLLFYRIMTKHYFLSLDIRVDVKLLQYAPFSQWEQFLDFLHAKKRGIKWDVSWT